MTQNILPPMDVNHNVYVLGAGFSKSRGLPLTLGFLNAIRDTYSTCRSPGVLQQEAAALAEVLHIRRAAAGAASRICLAEENIEDLFSYALAKDTTSLDRIPWALTATLQAKLGAQPAPAGRLGLFSGAAGAAPAALPPNWRVQGQIVEAPVYELIVAHLLGRLGSPASVPDAESNTFITFNYDLLIEEAMSALGVPFTYAFRKPNVDYADGGFSQVAASAGQNQSAVRVLKLHGSMNWGSVQSQGRRFTVYRDYDSLRGAQNIIAPVVVPPTWNKVPAGQLEDIWLAAIQQLQRATRIVIIGYSFPPTDVHFRYLMAAGLEDNIALRKILIINPSAAQPDYEESLYAIFRQQLYTDGMLTLQPSTLEEALERRVGDWFGRGMAAPYGQIHLRT